MWELYNNNPQLYNAGWIFSHYLHFEKFTSSSQCSKRQMINPNDEKQNTT
jgi:hypothetical protein